MRICNFLNIINYNHSYSEAEAESEFQQASERFIHIYITCQEEEGVLLISNRQQGACWGALNTPGALLEEYVHGFIPTPSFLGEPISIPNASAVRVSTAGCLIR